MQLFPLPLHLWCYTTNSSLAPRSVPCRLLQSPSQRACHMTSVTSHTYVATGLELWRCNFRTRPLSPRFRSMVTQAQPSLASHYEQSIANAMFRVFHPVWASRRLLERRRLGLLVLLTILGSEAGDTRLGGGLGFNWLFAGRPQSDSWLTFSRLHFPGEIGDTQVPHQL